MRNWHPKFFLSRPSLLGRPVLGQIFFDFRREEGKGEGGGGGKEGDEKKNVTWAGHQSLLQHEIRLSPFLCLHQRPKKRAGGTFFLLSDTRRHCVSFFSLASILKIPCILSGRPCVFCAFLELYHSLPFAFSLSALAFLCLLPRFGHNANLLSRAAAKAGEMTAVRGRKKRIMFAHKSNPPAEGGASFHATKRKYCFHPVFCTQL